MIYTQFGSEVEILHYDSTTSTVQLRRVKDGSILSASICCLQADDGLEEIEVAIQATGYEGEL